MSRRPSLITQATVAKAIRAADKAMPDDTFIYFLRAGPFVKIGHSKVWKTRRAQMQVGSPYDIVPILVLIGSKELERTLHRKFKIWHYRGEWFHMCEYIAVFVKEHRSDCVANAPMVDLRPMKREVVL